MPDKRFNTIAGPYKISDIIKLIDCEMSPPLDASNDILINDIKPLHEAATGELSFLSNKKYLTEFKNTKASACIVSADLKQKPDSPVILLKVKNPYFAYGKVVDLFYQKAKTYLPGIMASAYVASSATIGKNCYIGHNVVIEDNVVIGDGSFIEAGCFIGQGVEIGNNARIYCNSSIRYALIGNDAVIGPGACIGQDGFGFATEAGVHHKIYHTGRVIIGNNVEIGANTTIDRGSMGDTIIGDLCRLDNLIQIGHNVKLGLATMIAGQTGIAGSSVIGKYCALGGQVGVSGHINIGDMVQIAGQTGVMQNIPPNSIMGGSPAVPFRDWLKQSVIMKKLVEGSK